MSIAKTLWTVGRAIPQTDEEDWGDEVTDLLVDLTDGVEAATVETAAAGVFPKLRTATTTLGAGATLTPTAPRMKIAGTSAPVTLSATTAIADGEFDGQVLELQGNHAANTVTIQDAANTSLNGDMILGQRMVLGLVWDATDGLWIERYRSH